MRRTVGRLAAASLVVLIGAACTPASVPQPSPTPTPSATPPETAQEREQRIAYAAAEMSYRTYRAEFNRVLRDGGASKPTQVMSATAGNGYLKDTQAVATAFAGLRYKNVGVEKIVYVHTNGYAPDSVQLRICEDTTGLTTKNDKNAVVGKGEIRILSVEVKNEAGRWKVWSGSGQKVSSCD